MNYPAFKRSHQRSLRAAGGFFFVDSFCWPQYFILNKDINKDEIKSGLL